MRETNPAIEENRQTMRTKTRMNLDRLVEENGKKTQRGVEINSRTDNGIDL
jgi:hypothetical protein